MNCAIFMICILLSVTFVMYFNGRNKEIYYYYWDGERQYNFKVSL